MNEETKSKKLDKLNLLLKQVQNDTVAETFIYGVTVRSSRSLTDKINDYLIDHSSISLREKSYFFELLSTMIKSGISLVKSLAILETKTDHKRMKRIIATIKYDVEHGKAFSQSLEVFSDVFNESICGVVRSAEATGSLDHALAKIATNLSSQDELRSQILGALVYPMAVMAALLISMGVIVTFVIPKLKSMFEENNLQMPPTTRFFLNAGEWVSNHWWLLAILALFVIAAFHAYTHSDEGRFSWHFQKLRFPFTGKLLRSIYVLRFVDTLGLLIESGLPINKALEFVANSLGNEVYKVKTYEALANVQSGEPLSKTLIASPFLFPETVSNMIAVAEQSANIGEISLKVGAHYQHEINNTLKNMTTLLGPLVILVIGAAVAFFAIAVLSPIFSLTSSIT